MSRPRKTDPLDLVARGERLSQAIERLKLTPDVVAKMIGVHPHTMKMWLEGRREMHLKDIRALSQALGQTGAWLAYGERN